MPIVLVVDDSEVDRRMIGGLLEKELDWLVTYAEGGQEALELMDTVPPNVVITDLVMPGVDGLQLVGTVREQFHRVPVILVTGQGSEAVASRALRLGAASYVPKTHLHDELVETVKQVLSLAMADRNLDQLMQRSINIRHKFHLDNDPALVRTFIELVQQTLHRMAFCNATDRLRIAVALEEALLNALYHGNLELPNKHLPSVRQQLHESGVSPLVEERRGNDPYRQRRILVGFDVTPERAQFVIRDHGAGFDTETFKRLVAAETTMTHDGRRGLVLIHNIMDEVDFNREGNEIRMTVNRPKQAAQAKTPPATGQTPFADQPTTP